MTDGGGSCHPGDRCVHPADGGVGVTRRAADAETASRRPAGRPDRDPRDSAARATSRPARSRRSAPGPPPRARFVPAQTGGGDGDPPGRGVRCPGHPPPSRGARAQRHASCVCAGGGVAGGGPRRRPARPSAGRPVAPGATGSARPRRVPRWPRRCSARPSARFSTPRRASRRWWTRRAR